MHIAENIQDQRTRNAPLPPGERGTGNMQTQNVAKIILSSLISILICLFEWNAIVMTVHAHEADGSNAALQWNSESDDQGSQDEDSQDLDPQGSEDEQIPVFQYYDEEYQETIVEDDGMIWTLQDIMENKDGSKTYTYTDNSNVQFDDGGLGDAELIIVEES